MCQAEKNICKICDNQSYILVVWWHISAVYKGQKWSKFTKRQFSLQKFSLWTNGTFLHGWTDLKKQLLSAHLTQMQQMKKVKIWEQRLFLENIFFEALFEKISHILLQFVNEHHHCFNQAPNVDWNSTYKCDSCVGCWGEPVSGSCLSSVATNPNQSGQEGAH